jgi:hypothetical protein
VAESSHDGRRINDTHQKENKEAKIARQNASCSRFDKVDAKYDDNQATGVHKP